LLRTRAAVFLGHVSYSVYLVHCLILYASIKLLGLWTPFATLGPTPFWLFCLPVAAAVVLAAAFTYRFVEHPFLSARPAPVGVPAPAKSPSL